MTDIQMSKLDLDDIRNSPPYLLHMSAMYMCYVSSVYIYQSCLSSMYIHYVCLQRILAVYIYYVYFYVYLLCVSAMHIYDVYLSFMALETIHVLPSNTVAENYTIQKYSGGDRLLWT